MPATYDVIETYEKALEAEKQKNYLKAARLHHALTLQAVAERRQNLC